MKSRDRVKLATRGKGISAEPKPIPDPEPGPWAKMSDAELRACALGTDEAAGVSATNELLRRARVAESGCTTAPTAREDEEPPF